MSNLCPKCGTNYDGAEKFCPKDGTKLGGTGSGEYVKRHSITAEKDPLIGKIIQGRYRVIEQLGEGGMGVVYIAEHVEIEKKVALKVLRDDFSKRPEVVARFRQEARSASKVGSAHIVDVTDFGQLENGGVYFVMEYLKGKGLSEVIREEKIELERAVNIVTQIANALQEAHKMGIVHRDLKPENIFLVEQDEIKDFVKVLDFGIAKISDRDSEGERLTKTGMIFGTPEYMSPEQAAGRELDNRVDIYALGCIMYEIFTGSVPFDGDSFMAILTQHMFEPVPNIKEVKKETVATESVQAVVYKAMAKEKENRYESMKELAEDLKRAQEENKYGLEKIDRKKVEGLKKEKWKEKSTVMDWTPITEKEKEKSKKSITIIILIILITTILIAIYVKEKKGKITTIKEEITGKEIEEKKKDTVEEKKELVIKEKEKIEKIKVEIQSEPKGAVIIIAGLGQVCSSAPCDVEVEEGKPLEIEAKFGKNENKKMRFTPSEQNRKIMLEKEEKKRVKKKKTETIKKKNETKIEKTDTRDNGLKIPKIFKDN